MNSKKLAEGMLLWAKKPIHTSLTKMDDNEARKLAPKVRNKEEGGGREMGHALLLLAPLFLRTGEIEPRCL